jgi:lipopolysaccharide/colanic/teichoic acid biosynthesis glycosyltransferase
MPVMELSGARQKTVTRFGDNYAVTYAYRIAPFALLFIKRVVDIIGGLVGCVFFLLELIFIGPLIRLDSPGPVIFKQNRVGRNGRVFEIYKLRTMRADAEALKKDLEKDNEMNGLMFKMENDPRITKVGRFLRKTSLDEVPQFFNVLKGDMSLVGTRPPTVDEFRQYSPYHKKRLSFRPGITGLWQVSGRNSIVDFDDILKLDVDYIDSWSLALDVKILAKTFVAIFNGK